MTSSQTLRPNRPPWSNATWHNAGDRFFSKHEFLIVGIVLLLLLTVSLVHWVQRPLSRTMESLNRDDPQPIISLCQDNTEFGELARTIQKFFEQRDNLIREMEERRSQWPIAAGC